MPTQEQIQQLQRKLDLASAVARHIAIDWIRLFSSAISRTEELFIESLPKHIRIESNTQSSVNSVQKKISVVADFSLSATYALPDASPPSAPPLLIKARFDLMYSAATLEGLSEEHIQAFGEVNGLYNAWPYWREFVQNSVVRMGLPPFTIPVYRATQIQEDPVPSTAAQSEPAPSATAQDQAATPPAPESLPSPPPLE